MNHGKKGTILVLYNAGPLDVSWAVNSNKVVAIIESFFPAQVTSLPSNDSFNKRNNNIIILFSHSDWW